MVRNQNGSLQDFLKGEAKFDGIGGKEIYTNSDNSTCYLTMVYYQEKDMMTRW